MEPLQARFFAKCNQLAYVPVHGYATFFAVNAAVVQINNF